MHPSFGQTNSVCSVEPICRCGVGQVLPATNILQERLTQAWGAPSPQKKWSWNQVAVAGWLLLPLPGVTRGAGWRLGASPPGFCDAHPACSVVDASVVREVCVAAGVQGVLPLPEQLIQSSTYLRGPGHPGIILPAVGWTQVSYSSAGMSSICLL